ncbi:MAG: biotin--[acetyl-CoA-carboxylase] ligase [Candidatus Zixiibacteriota bacterium]|nr:MAG: biotin--[acetyl-CoA-carboxylase] ligase [candidate division Zixibacteria bacterium]
MSLQINHDQLADKILLYTRSKPQEFFSIQTLSKFCNCNLSDIITAYNILVTYGYIFDKNKNDELKFISAPDTLSSTEVGYNLKTKFIGQTCYSYNKIKSTNDIASDLAEQNAPEGTIITADEQTKGRGRLGRVWHSSSGTGIYLSLILRPKFSPEEAPGISLITALSLAETINEIIPDKVKIKWPNDVLISGKKTAGILSELSAEKNKINYLIIGVGININQTTADFPDNIINLATSIRISAKTKISRVKLLQQFLTKLEKEYLLYQKHSLKKSHKRLLQYSSLLNKEITLLSGKEKITGKVIDINIKGALVIKIGDKIKAFSSGEVTIVKDMRLYKK